MNQVQICNRALLKFGDVTITAITDDTKQARACNVLWDQLRDELLYQHPWNFAMKRADLGGYLSETPAFGYDYKYTLPAADYLRVWELYDSDGNMITTNWEVESGELLTDEEEAFIRYIAKVTDPAKFNPMFANCLSLLLAIELTSKLGEKGQKPSLQQELVITLRRAFALNAIEGNSARHQDEKPLDENTFSWVTER